MEEQEYRQRGASGGPAAEFWSHDTAVSPSHMISGSHHVGGVQNQFSLLPPSLRCLSDPLSQSLRGLASPSHQNRVL